MTRTISPTRDEIQHAGELIRSGGLVAFPTETVYGLGANALDPDAVERIFAAKGRPATSPLIVHVDSVEMARTVVADWPESAALLAQEYWPGPLTLVLPKQQGIPDRVTAGLPTVGVRVPRHPVALELIRAAGVPICAPSANRFTELSPTEAVHVRDALGHSVDAILDGGRCEVGIESTVLSLAGSEPVLLRPGMVSLADIERRIGFVSYNAGPAAGGGGHASPGQHARHYSPATPLLITRDFPSGLGAYVWWSEDRPASVSVRMPAAAAAYAREIYATLHRLDGMRLGFIAVEPVPGGDDWAGIRDRLKRAACRD
jgi:L-threonylcarbamoyladenylate synthase